MSTMTKPHTGTTFASRWWTYFRNMEQAMDFDSQAYTKLSLRELRQTVATLEARVAGLEAGTECAFETELPEYTQRRVYHG